MRMSLEERFSVLGFSKNEARVYAALLRNGGAFVGALAKETGMERVSLYYTLELLTEKGMVLETNRRRMKFYLPEKPEKMLNLQKERVNIALELVPELKAMENAGLSRPIFKLFEGIDGIREVLGEVFQKPEIWSYANVRNLIRYDKTVLERALDEVHRKRIRFKIILPYHE